jgi:hypothetical protein
VRKASRTALQEPCCLDKNGYAGLCFALSISSVQVKVERAGGCAACLDGIAVDLSHLKDAVMCDGHMASGCRRCLTPHEGPAGLKSAHGCAGTPGILATFAFPQTQYIPA